MPDIVVGTSGNEILILNTDTGQESWQTATPQDIAKTNEVINQRNMTTPDDYISNAGLGGATSQYSSGLPTYNQGQVAYAPPPAYTPPSGGGDSGSQTSGGGGQPSGGNSGQRVVSESGWDFLVYYDANGKEIAREALGKTATPEQTGQNYKTYPEALKNLPNSGYDIVQLSNGMWGYKLRDVPQMPTPFQNNPPSQYQTADLDLQRKQLQAQIDYWNQQAGQAQASQQASSQQAADQLAWEKQQSAAQQLIDQRNYVAKLAANPASWLEYAQASGETPMVQPWMIPLMGNEYAGTVAGSQLPGYQSGSPTMAQLPALTTPSAQYAARMGPTAYQQYAGYEQARSGINPTELQFRMWSQAPPSGNYQQLRYGR